MNVIFPSLALKPNVLCFSTNRFGGVSEGPFTSLNLGLHVGDEAEAVLQNRRKVWDFCHQLAGKKVLEPFYMQQAHTTRVESLDIAQTNTELSLDAVFTQENFQALCVMTADCMPIILSDGETIMALHAGWKGLAEGIIEKALTKFEALSSLSVWIGPCIGPQKFEVGIDVKTLFPNYDHYFMKSGITNKYFLDLPAIAMEILALHGVSNIQSSQVCTYENDDYFSHRRATHQNASTTGRNATIVIKIAN